MRGGASAREFEVSHKRGTVRERHVRRGGVRVPEVPTQADFQAAHQIPQIGLVVGGLAERAEQHRGHLDRAQAAPRTSPMIARTP